MKKTLFILLAVLGGSLAASAQDTKEQKAKLLVISKETMTMTVYGLNANKIAEYPVAMGKNLGNKKKAGDHKTPEGTFKIQQIQDASYWTHDFRDGKGEIKGAYGSHFIRLLTPPHKGIGIHGTHDPASIGTRATEGCIRLKNEDLLELVKMIYIDMPVTIVTSEKDQAADN